jgi:hypothetical protein
MGRKVRIASGFAIFGIATLMFIVASYWPVRPPETVTSFSSLPVADVEAIAEVVRRDMLPPNQRKLISGTQSLSERLLARLRGEEAELNISIDTRPNGTVQVEARFWHGGSGGFERKYELNRRGADWTITHIEEGMSVAF